MNHSTLVTLQDLVKQYPGSDTPAVDGLSLRIREGEFFGFLGPNGAGKTTTISMMCGLLSPTSGEIWYNDISLKQHPTACFQLIGFVPQEIALYENLTIVENVRFFGKMQGLRGAHLHKRIDECLEVVSLSEHRTRQIKHCSGGMKRRANIAVGILHRPKLLLLDEPTVGIDVQSRNMIFENLRVLNEEGMTVLYTTHYMEEVEQLCSRVAIVDNGSVLTEGEPWELLAQKPECDNLEQLFLALTGKQLRDR
ncbi:MAG TPA: ABC transporter [Myxococcales bacterium]|nr:ABC transporter [Deltaproteobacteria bacterium]MBU52007.1 ABC transporter [Deltaproteobacteria bacterium]HAA59269.1 ABC transporter [Myxococcales bacterium]|tara:strand:+ start:1562 stop:2317 length:756 start_codon:yes stop_codon:yes gene_type:complete